MFGFILTISLIIIFLILLLVIYTIYNKLMFYNNELINNYNDLYKLIEEKINVVNNGKMSKDSDLEDYINKFKILDLEDDVINLSLDLDRLVKSKYSKRKFYNSYKDILNKIELEKKKYNDNVLIFNSLIKMVPISFISNIFGFEEWLYYRND